MKISCTVWEEFPLSRGELIALDMYLFPIDIHKGLQQKVKMLEGYQGKFFPCTIQKCKRSDLPAIEHNVT